MERFFLILAVCIILLRIAAVDMSKKRIPNGLLGVLFVCALFSVFWFPEIVWWERIAGGVLVSALLLLIIWVRPHSFGAGDVKLMAVSGFLLGLGRNVAAFVFAVGIAAVYCGIGILSGRQKRDSVIAFGPFLCVGIILAIFFGDTFVNWYIG